MLHVINRCAEPMIAFFDLDRTLLDVNSGGLWVKSEYRLGYISRWQLLKALFSLARYHLGVVKLEPLIRRAIRLQAGVPEAELRGRTETFFEREVRARFRAGGLRAIAEHRARGDRLVLLTTSSCFLADCVLREVGLDDVLATHFVIDAEGNLTGAASEPLCYGAGKLTLAAEYAAVLDVPLSACTFYTDSYADRPVLEAVGHPVAVHPDPRLRQLARARSWPMVKWD